VGSLTYYPCGDLLVDGREAAITLGIGKREGDVLFLCLTAVNLMRLLVALGATRRQVPKFTRKGVRGGVVHFKGESDLTLAPAREVPAYVGKVKTVIWTECKRDERGRLDPAEVTIHVE
jgi:hypothetical protein